MLTWSNIYYKQNKYINGLQQITILLRYTFTYIFLAYCNHVLTLYLIYCRCLECTHLQKLWSLVGCHWWRPAWWFGFWYQPSRSSPPGHHSPPLWHHRYLGQSVLSLRSCRGCQCPHRGFQTAAHTGGTFSTLVRWLRNQSFKQMLLCWLFPDPGESMRITTWCKCWCQSKEIHMWYKTHPVRYIVYCHSDNIRRKHEKWGRCSCSPKQDCLLGESFIRCGQVQDAVWL